VWQMGSGVFGSGPVGLRMDIKVWQMRCGAVR
jgi:hypothetical protein